MCVSGFFPAAFVPENLTFIFLLSLFKHHHLDCPNPSFLDCPRHVNKIVSYSPGTKQFSIPSTLCMAGSMLLCVVQVLPDPTFANRGREVPADSASLLLASIPLHKSISLAVIVCNLCQKDVWSQTALKVNTKGIKRWCVGNDITLTLQKSTFLLYPIWLQFYMSHKILLSSHSL